MSGALVEALQSDESDVVRQALPKAIDLVATSLPADGAPIIVPSMKDVFSVVSALGNTLHMDPSHVPAFAALIPRLFVTIGAAFAAQEYQLCVTMMTAFQECIGEQNPDLLDRATVEKLCVGLASIAGAQAPQEVRVAALDMLVEVAEFKPRYVSNEFASMFVDMMVGHLARPGGSEDGMDWPLEIEDEQEVAAQHLDRFTQAVSRKAASAMNNVIAKSLATWGDLPWSAKVATFLATTYSIEGCTVSLNMGKIMQLQALGVRDSHPQVQTMALLCIGQCFVDVFDDAAKVIALRHHVDLVVAVLDPKASLDAPHLRLLQAALSYTNSCMDAVEFDDDDSSATKESFVAQFQTPLLLERLLHVLKGGYVDCSITAKALELFGTLVEIAPVGAGRWIPSILEITLPLLAESGPVAALTSDDRGVLESALQCVGLTAGAIGADAFKPYEARTCEFLCSAMETTKDDDPFMIRLLRGWTCMTECLGRGIEQWLPRFAGKLVAGASLDVEPHEISREEADRAEAAGDAEDITKLVVRGSGTKYLRISTATCEFKAQCFVILVVIVRMVPLTVFGKDLVTQFATVGCNNVASSAMSSIRDNASELIEAILIKQRKDGGDAHQYLSPKDAVDNFSTAVESETDVEVRPTLIRCMTCVVASLRGVVPAETTKDAVRACMQVIDHYSYADVSDMQESHNNGDVSVLNICWMLGYLLRATAPGDDGHQESMMQAHNKLDSHYSGVPPAILALSAGHVAFGRPADIVAKRADIVHKASGALELAGRGEAEPITVQMVLELATELLDATARVEGFALDREFVMSVVRVCQTLLCNDDEEEVVGDLVRGGVRAAMAAAEWLKRNNAPEAAGSAVAMCANHLAIEAMWESVFEADEATAIVDKLAHWAADPELSAVYFAFPMSRDDVLEALGESEFLSPAGAAALEEARSVEMPESLLPTKKRQR